ncbi:Phosphatidylinositol 4-kinase gamma 1 [Morella rubra]|uniref:1-phosphatidylinositol 4-kinase n=1 Tax=Morella rubra TaxID=262757 RepID=A0A6A1WBM8_9ROSI|nr:Phosphatidylinositol 4-kinase gamma 1 [Morella rubra]
MAVAVDQHHKTFKPFSRSQRCRLQSYTHLDQKFLEQNQTNLAHSLQQGFEADNIHRSVSTPCLSITTPVEEEFDIYPTIRIVGGHEDPKVSALVVEVAVALASGIDPMLVSGGLGGAYFLSNGKGKNIAVAKPIDEEPLAFNNPKGFGGRLLGQPGLKRSVRIGETGIRESAAYLLDHGGFAGVPPTALVKMSNVAFCGNNEATVSAAHYTIASLQRFVDHNYDAGELGSSGFSVASVHRIAILDIRLLNLDRHAGNILIKKQEQDNYEAGIAELVPIDHGICLPEWLDDPYFEWLHWPQASVPFSEYELEYISHLDPFKDAELLRTKLPWIRESSIRVLVVCTIFLKEVAAIGLCLTDIGEMMTRDFRYGEENLSVLENLCAQAKASLPNISDIGDRSKPDETSEEDEIFQFENENEESFGEVGDLNLLIKSHPVVAKPPKISRFSSTGSMTGLLNAVLPPLYEEMDHFHENDTKDNELGNEDQAMAVTIGKVGVQRT